MFYCSTIIYTVMIPDFNKLVNGSSLSLPAHGRAGARATPFLAALFAKQKTKFGGGTPVVERFAFTTGQEARAGREFIFPTPLFLPAPPERKLSKVGVRIFSEKSSDFVQDRQPICKVCISRLARGFAPRFGERIFKQFPNEPIFFSPEGRTQSDNFLPKSDYKLKYKTI